MNASNATLYDSSLRQIANGLLDGGFDPLQQHWREWLPDIFPHYFGDFGEHHAQLWDWVWAIQPKVRPRPFVAIWSRKHGKSTSAEVAAVALGARMVRNYVMYVCETQDQANDHVANIAALLENPEVEARYPGLGVRSVGKYGHSKGWRRNRLRTQSGLNIDAYGMDTSMRGVRLERYRPDAIICDDLDNDADTPPVIERKLARLTRAIIPTGSNDVAILLIQNLISPRGIFAQLAKPPSQGGADYLANRIVSGPVPAVEDLEVERAGDEWRVTGGRPTWNGFDLADAEAEINATSLTDFLTEYNHRVIDPAKVMIKRGWFPRAPRPDNVRWVRGWDLATKAKQRADRTASVRIGFAAGETYMDKPIAERLDTPDAKALIKRTILAEPDTAVHVIEANAFQISVVQDLLRDPDLLRATIVGVTVHTDKVARSSGWRTRAKEHRINLVDGYDWVPWLDEWEEFPNGLHDDRVDAVSIAYQRLIDDPPEEIPPPISLTGASRWVGA